MMCILGQMGKRSELCVNGTIANPTFVECTSRQILITTKKNVMWNVIC